MALALVFFDLDGTLVDARDAAWEIFAETSETFELGIDTQEKFLALSETNFFAALSAYCTDEKLAVAVTDHFMDGIRDRYNPPFIPGMIDIVKEFSAQTPLAILSSNMRDTIQRILTAGGITQYFPHIIAGDEEPSKSTAIASFLSANGQEIATSAGDNRAPISNHEAAMVTDTVGDVGEALSSGIRVCGVTWGMHSKQQLLTAGAEYAADTPADLMEWFNKAHSGVNIRS